MDDEALDAHPEDARAVLDFWFNALKPEHWWKRDETVDARIVSCFTSLYERVADEVPAEWLATPGGCLAAIIVLDQFPRNMFRDDSRAFASDARAVPQAMAKSRFSRRAISSPATFTRGSPDNQSAGISSPAAASTSTACQTASRWSAVCNCR